MEDAQIIALYNKRSENAIVESDKKYGSYCFSVANNILNDREDSRECVNDTWLKTWSVIPPQYPERLKLFFAKITRNLSLDRLRTRSRIKRGAGETAMVLEELGECISDNNVESDLDFKILAAVINDFLRNIPKRERRMFLQRYFFVESIGKIAKRFGITENACAVILCRTRSKLKKFLEQKGFSV